jgi:integrase
LNYHETDVYTHELGKLFIDILNVYKSTLVRYSCAIRRLDDYIDGNPYRCHHGDFKEQVAPAFSKILRDYIRECKDNGNKPLTLSFKERTCIVFLNYLVNHGYRELSQLNTCIVSQALLTFTNKEAYAIVRQFLNYLSEKGFTEINYSGIVPRYKKSTVLPTTYTPDEISRVEAAVDTNTIAGKRNLAIIRLASRMGLRAGDIAKLKISEINFSTGYISIIQEKTGLPLTLQMPVDVANAIIMHLENDKLSLEDGYVFHSLSAPYGCITTSIIRHAINKCFIAANVNTTGKKHGPHAFRSSLASSMVNDNASYEVVRRILGHSSPDVINHYAKVDIENLRKCSIDPPIPTGVFNDYLSGKEVIVHVQ